MVRVPHRRRAAERGQALLETAIIMPVMVFATLGALQLMLVQHGRIQTEYAAYCAARAGIVHSGNWNVMRNAALIAALPVYARTDTPRHFLEAWAKVKGAATLTGGVDTGIATVERLAEDLLGVQVSGVTQDISLIEVEVRSPTSEDFRAAEQYVDRSGDGLEYPEGEIDFDDLEMFADAQTASTLGTLALEVRVLYPLKIPVVNKLIFELWLAHELLRQRTFTGSLNDWAQFRTRTVDGQYLSEAVKQVDGQGPLNDFFGTSQWLKEVRTLRWLAERYNLYLVPLQASYAMQMQSNLFEDNQREPVWFTLGGGP
ncbi:MAG: TadE family protein [Myxococcota bacterium]